MHVEAMRFVIRMKAMLICLVLLLSFVACKKDGNKAVQPIVTQRSVQSTRPDSVQITAGGIQANGSTIDSFAIGNVIYKPYIPIGGSLAVNFFVLGNQTTTVTVYITYNPTNYSDDVYLESTNGTHSNEVDFSDFGGIPPRKDSAVFTNVVIDDLGEIILNGR